MTYPQIETARLRLWPVAETDMEALYRLWTDLQVRKYLFDDVVIPREQVVEESRRSQDLFDRLGVGLWAVSRKDGGHLIGFTGYRFFHDPPELQLLYGFASDHWSRGLATEAARAMIRYGFETCGFDRILASADPPNKASIRVMQKAGMAFEKQVVVDGLDTVYYALDRAGYRPGDAPYRVEPDESTVSGSPAS